MMDEPTYSRALSPSLLRSGSVYGSGLKGCAQVLKAIEQPLAN